MSDPRLERAYARFDAINAQDPATELVDGVTRPRELVHAERLTRWVLRLCPEPSPALQIAARCQHLGRFRVPRSTYPEGRVGYLKWRTDLGRYHADSAVEILEEVGYDAETIEKVRKIVRKQGLTSDPDVQTMEDALCLTFLEYEYAEFCERHDDDKILTIVVKTWRKMSPKAREHALALPLAGRAQALVERALSGATE